MKMIQAVMMMTITGAIPKKRNQQMMSLNMTQTKRIFTYIERNLLLEQRHLHLHSTLKPILAKRVNSSFCGDWTKMKVLVTGLSKYQLPMKRITASQHIMCTKLP